MTAFPVIWRALRNGYDELFNLAGMNFLTLVFQLTVLLGPPAMAALHAMSNRVANGFAISFSAYFAALRAHFLASWRFALPSVVLTALILFNFNFYADFADQTWAVWARGAWFAAFVITQAVQFYVYPLYFEQEVKSWRLAVRNAALVAGANPLYTAVLLIVALLITALSIVFVPLLFVLGLAIWTMFANTAAVDRLTKYRKIGESAVVAQERAE
jgi:uncharacterized membrane protein YesL